MTNSSARVLDARLLLSIIAAGIMSFSGVENQWNAAWLAKICGN